MAVEYKKHSIKKVAKKPHYELKIEGVEKKMLFSSKSKAEAYWEGIKKKHKKE